LGSLLVDIPNIKIYGYFADKPDRLYYLLFAGYLCLFAWLLTRLGFFQKSGLTNAQLVILFLLKVMAGIFMDGSVSYGQYAYMYDTYYII
jgi:hypothetical protein